MHNKGPRHKRAFNTEKHALSKALHHEAAAHAEYGEVCAFNLVDTCQARLLCTFIEVTASSQCLQALALCSPFSVHSNALGANELRRLLESAPACAGVAPQAQ